MGAPEHSNASPEANEPANAGGPAEEEASKIGGFGDGAGRIRGRKLKTYHGLSCFESWNELSLPVFIMDFGRGSSRYVWANKAYLEVYNSTLEDFCAIDLADLSQAVRKIFDETWEKVQVRGETVQDTKTVYPQGRTVTLETELKPVSILLDGEDAPKTFALVECAPVDKFAQCRIDAARSHELFKNYDIPTMMFSRDGTLLYANNLATRHYYGDDCPRDAYVTGRNMVLDDVFESMVWDREATAAQLIKEAKEMGLKDGGIEVESKKRITGFCSSAHKCLDHSWFRVRFFPVTDPLSGKLAIMVTETDISDLKSSQVELLEGRSVRDKFFMTASHELRTPLNGIIGLADSLLANSDHSSVVSQSLAAIRECGHTLSRLVNDILDASVCTNGAITLKYEELNLHSIAEAACEALKHKVDHGVEIINDIDPDLPVLQADAARIHKVFSNLVGNAVKFTHQGQIKLSGKVCKDKYVQIEVSDTGIGIPSDKLHGIWEKYHQVDMTCTRRYGGTGLGLWMVRTNIEAHNGSIRVSSSDNGPARGSRFTFILPLPAATAEQRNASSGDLAWKPRSCSKSTSFEGQLSYRNLSQGFNQNCSPLLQRRSQRRSFESFDTIEATYDRDQEGNILYPNNDADEGVGKGCFHAPSGPPPPFPPKLDLCGGRDGSLVSRRSSEPFLRTMERLFLPRKCETNSPGLSPSSAAEPGPK